MEFFRGEILYDPHFQYDSSKQADCDKYLLIINKNHIPTQDVVIIPATTNKHDIPYYDGCNEDLKIFYYDHDGSFYNKGTIIQLQFMRTLNIEWLEEMIENEGIIKKNKNLDKIELSQIINCLKKIKDDIPLDIQELIF